MAVCLLSGRKSKLVVDRYMSKMPSQFRHKTKTEKQNQTKEKTHKQNKPRHTAQKQTEKGKVTGRPVI